MTGGIFTEGGQPILAQRAPQHSAEGLEKHWVGKQIPAPRGGLSCSEADPGREPQLFSRPKEANLILQALVDSR